jgi:hypothetical protein
MRLDFSAAGPALARVTLVMIESHSYSYETQHNFLLTDGDLIGSLPTDGQRISFGAET